jgi:hypothetical protein
MAISFGQKVLEIFQLSHRSMTTGLQEHFGMCYLFHSCEEIWYPFVKSQRRIKHVFTRKIDVKYTLMVDKEIW